MFDIVVATNQAEDTTRVYNTNMGDLMVATEGSPEAGQVFVNIGNDRIVNLTKMEGGVKNIGSLSFVVRRLSSTDAVTMIVR